MLQRWRPSACQRRLFCKAVALQKAAAGSGYLDRPHGAAAQRDTQSAGARLKECHLQHITVTVTETATRVLSSGRSAALHRRLPRSPRHDGPAAREREPGDRATTAGRSN